MKLIRPMGVNDARLLSSNVAETDYTAWNSVTAYSVGDYVRYVAANTHRIYQALTANTGKNPSVYASDWLFIGATNRWRMFDFLAQAQTTNADSIDLTILGVGRQNSVALLNVSAASVRITQTDAVDGVVYDKTFSMAEGSVNDWYAYFFDPIARKTDLIVTDLKPYVDATIGVTLSDAGHTVACGECVIGQSRYIGRTQYGAGVGIQDYSTKEVDAFGNYSIVQRAFAKRASFRVMIDAGLTDYTQALLAEYRAIPIVYVGSDDYASTAVYGFFRDFNIEIAYVNDSLVTIEVEGLT